MSYIDDATARFDADVEARAVMFENAFGDTP